VEQICKGRFQRVKNIFHSKLLFGLLIMFFAFVQDPGRPASGEENATTQAYKDKTTILEIKEFRKKRNEFFKSHPRSPLKGNQKEDFTGLIYYPINLESYFFGKIRRYRLHITNPEYYAEFVTNKGTYKRYVRYGTFTFKLNGKEYELEIYKSILSDKLFIPFKDQTNGKETYAMGRYLDAEILPGYYTIVDFNKAYNSSCVYNSKYVCVIPPEKNFLDTEIRAGEKNYQ